MLKKNIGLERKRIKGRGSLEVKEKLKLKKNGKSYML